MKDPHNIIIQPYITEKSVAMSYGDVSIRNEVDLVRKYTFIVAKDANKLEIKQAFEAIYNAGKKEKENLEVTDVHTVKVYGKTKRRGRAKAGRTPDRKKAILTLGKGQILEDYGV